MTEEIEDLHEEREFDLELIGNFGRFVAAGSYPVEYFMASMTMAQAQNYLRFARDIQMEDIDFDLLMQRDIDEERIQDELLPYLQQGEGSAAARPIFFPPLLVAILPISDEALEHFYGAQEDVEPRPGFIGIKWRGDFQIMGRRTDGAEGLPLRVENPHLKIKARQAVLSLRTTLANPSGVTLVVIDGQHRLMALKRLYKEHREKVRDLVVPICIMYPPNSYNKDEGTDVTPTVPRVFRSLFVDVNSTMKVVGGHFNILLSDRTVGDLTCRAFCDAVLKEKDRSGLACIEWNTRTKKDSYKVTKKYSLTSIGVIWKGLEDNFSPDMLVHYLLNITAGSDDIFPEGADPDDYYPRIKWDKFSYAQSKAISKRSKDFLAPLLIKVFFESVPFRELWSFFSREIDVLKAEVAAGGRAGAAAQAVLQKVLDYKPIDDKEPGFSSRLMRFEEDVKSHREKANLDIVRYALFQRAMFNVASVFVRLGLEFRVPPEKAFDGFIEMLNAVFERDREAFAPLRAYMQYTVFNQHRIRTREDTRLALRDLMLAHLLREDIRSRVVNTGFAEAGRAVEDRLEDIGFNAAGEFLGRYREERRKAFRKGYELDYSLSQAERAQLKLKEMEQHALEREVKEGRRDEESVVREFDQEVNRYVEEYLNEAKRDLRDALGVANDLLEISDSELEDAEEA